MLLHNGKGIGSIAFDKLGGVWTIERDFEHQLIQRCIIFYLENNKYTLQKTYESWLGVKEIIYILYLSMFFSYSGLCLSFVYRQ